MSDSSDIDKLLAVFLDYDAHPWRREAEVIEGYMPEFPRPDTKPITVVRWRSSFLRHSRGPLQRHSWDIYGDDYMTRELALLALSQAPPHPRLLRVGTKGLEGETEGWAAPVRSSSPPSSGAAGAGEACSICLMGNCRYCVATKACPEPCGCKCSPASTSTVAPAEPARCPVAGCESPMPHLPCPHARPSWHMCPHCLGLNAPPPAEPGPGEGVT